jgi:hypothetical protein
MENETIFFDEEVKGHKLLITSHDVIYKGKRFQTSLIDTVSTVTSLSTVNAVPTSATFIVSLTCKGDTIEIRCSGFAWFGRTQFERLKGVVHKEIGTGLIVDALRKFMTGETIAFEHKGTHARKAQPVGPFALRRSH